MEFFLNYCGNPDVYQDHRKIYSSSRLVSTSLNSQGFFCFLFVGKVVVGFFLGRNECRRHKLSTEDMRDCE